MQVLLTEEEHTSLKNKSFEYDCIEKSLSTLITKFDELQSKYYKLLAHGVSSNNERLKTTNDSRFT